LDYQAVHQGTHKKVLEKYNEFWQEIVNQNASDSDFQFEKIFHLQQRSFRWKVY
jgi:hypothetical protein